MRFRLINRPRFPIRQHPLRPRWLHDDAGTAAIEFAIVALPFLLFVLGLLGMGLYFLATTSLEYGVEAASRKVRTGESRTAGTPKDGKPTEMTVADFKQLVCDTAGSYIDCNKLSVMVQHAADWSGISPPSCLDGAGNPAGSTGNSGDVISKYAGGAGEVVLVTLCYQWDLANDFPFIKLGANADGSGTAIIQAATAFKSEPYNSAG
jgi:hypothetical protein